VGIIIPVDPKEQLTLTVNPLKDQYTHSAKWQAKEEMKKEFGTETRNRIGGSRRSTQKRQWNDKK